MAQASPTSFGPDMRGQILASATRLFAESGYASTSLQALADAVGIRKQSLLYHFPTKEALREAVLEAVFSCWKERIPRALVAATSGEERFSSATRVVIEFFAEDTNRARLVIRELLDRPGPMKKLLRESLEPWLGLITGHIRAGIERGELRPEVDPAAYVVQTAALIVCVTAAADVLRVGFPEGTDRESGTARLLVETQRIARTALFESNAAGSVENAQEPKAE